MHSNFEQRWQYGQPQTPQAKCKLFGNGGWLYIRCSAQDPSLLLKSIFLWGRDLTNESNLRYNQTWNPSRLVYRAIKTDENLIPGSTAASKQCFHSANNNTRHLQTVALYTRVFGPAKRKKKQSLFSAQMV